jgi:carbon-monoxide dehydrogenase iron sulfur subunit
MFLNRSAMSKITFTSCTHNTKPMFERSLSSEKKARLKNIWVVTPGIGRTKFRVVPTECTGCRYCESACSFYNEGITNPRVARIKVITKDAAWQRHETDTINTHIICKQCPGVPACMAVCPVEDAMIRHPETGSVLIDHDKCIKCRQCEKACPYGPAVFYSEKLDKMLKCTLCNGKPKCVEYCPIGVLTYKKIT